MPTFALICRDKPEAAALLKETRPRHLDYFGQSAVVVRLGGPILNDAGEPVGSLIIIDAESRTAAEDFSANDPYTQAGVFEAVEILPYQFVAGDLLKE